jgi:hypothetical protein
MATALTPSADELQRFAQHPPHCASEASSEEIPRLYAALELVNERTHPRTAHLVASGVKKMAQKVMEEAGEVAIEAVRRRRPAVGRRARISSIIWLCFGASAASSRMKFGPK